MKMGTPPCGMGTPAKVDLLLEEERQVVMVPFESVRQDRENIEYVYVFEGGKPSGGILKPGWRQRRVWKSLRG